MSAIALKYNATWVYSIKLLSSMLLISFIALIASSKNFFHLKHIPELFRQSLWSIEAFAMIIGSSLYVFLRKSTILNSSQPILLLNSITLVLIQITPSPLTLILTNFLLSLLIMLAFYKFRDDYVLSAGSNSELINGFSAFSLAQRDLVCTLSPVILSYLFSHYHFLTTVNILIIAQICLFISAWYLEHPSQKRALFFKTTFKRTNGGTISTNDTH